MLGHLSTNDLERVNSSAAPAAGDEVRHLLAKQLGRTASTLITSSTEFTKAANTTAYTAGDVVGPATTALLSFQLSRETSVAPGCILISAMLRIANASVPSGMAGFRLHLFNGAPTALADNAAFSLETADEALYAGYVDLPTPQDFGNALISQATGILLQVPLDSNGSIKGMLQTLGGYTPASGTKYLVDLSAVTP